MMGSSAAAQQQDATAALRMYNGGFMSTGMGMNPGMGAYGATYGSGQ